MSSARQGSVVNVALDGKLDQLISKVSLGPEILDPVANF